MSQEGHEQSHNTCMVDIRISLHQVGESEDAAQTDGHVLVPEELYPSLELPFNETFPA